ncbi:hypothetical protein NEMBOFW57_005622 [Staphylotrichum longicolle]|uniref:Uncharacterized protein n=1 Tax=Staphylotrichum longicolle TaxID=669026 RepID=A0AAD4EXD7_9PEZI|nr:hypothetical protein NEMBOFW57_005622 [Staphylotrichum longicolle]
MVVEEQSEDDQPPLLHSPSPFHRQHCRYHSEPPGPTPGEPAAKYDFDPSALGTSSSSNLLPPSPLLLPPSLPPPPLLPPLAGGLALPSSLPLPSDPPLSLTGDTLPGVGASSTYRRVRVIFLSLSLRLDDGETSFTFSTTGTGDGDGDGVPRSVPSGGGRVEGEDGPGVEAVSKRRQRRGEDAEVEEGRVGAGGEEVEGEVEEGVD